MNSIHNSAIKLALVSKIDIVSRHICLSFQFTNLLANIKRLFPIIKSWIIFYFSSAIIFKYFLYTTVQVTSIAEDRRKEKLQY